MKASSVRDKRWRQRSLQQSGPVYYYIEYFVYTGSLLVTISLIFFVLSTIIVIIFYSSRQAEYLYSVCRQEKIMKAVYVVSIVIGSIGGAQMIWHFLDLMWVMILIPNMIAVLLLSGEVKRLTTEFFASEKYYKKDIAEEEAS